MFSVVRPPLRHRSSSNSLIDAIIVLYVKPFSLSQLFLAFAWTFLNELYFTIVDAVSIEDVEH
jgi:hypothetical protein